MLIFIHYYKVKYANIYDKQNDKIVALKQDPTGLGMRLAIRKHKKLRTLEKLY